MTTGTITKLLGDGSIGLITPTDARGAAIAQKDVFFRVDQLTDAAKGGNVQIGDAVIFDAVYPHKVTVGATGNPFAVTVERAPQGDGQERPASAPTRVTGAGAGPTVEEQMRERGIYRAL